MAIEPVPKLSIGSGDRTPECVRPAVRAENVEKIETLHSALPRASNHRPHLRTCYHRLPHQQEAGDMENTAKQDVMEVRHPVAAGLDVHKMQITASVRIWSGAAMPDIHTEVFNALASGLVLLVQ